MPVGQVVYQSNDCTGMPLVQSGGLLAQVQVVGNTVLYPAQPSGVTSGSSVEGNDQSQACVVITPRGGCCRAITSTGVFRQAATTTFATLGIQLPLRVTVPS